MVTVVNSVDRLWEKGSFVFVHQYDSPCLVYGASLDSALEVYADYLSIYRPGLLMVIGGEEHKKLIDDYLKDNNLVLEGLTDDRKCEIFDKAESDLTLTESGFLTSHEWSIALENPNRAALKKFVEEHGGACGPRQLWPGWRVSNEGRVCEVRHTHVAWCGEQLPRTLERVYTKITCLGCISEKGSQ